MITLVVVVIVIALAFDYTNGFHDSANAIALAVSTRAMPPKAAVAMAAVMNVVGALISTKVAKTVGKGIIATPPHDRGGLVVVLAALVGAIIWNLATWYFGLPSSSTHALVGGLVGAALASSQAVKWSGVFEKVVIPMVISPVIGGILAYLLMLVLLWSFRNRNQHRTNLGFRRAQIFSSAAAAFSHGTQDAQKTMGVIALTLMVSGHLHPNADIPLWVILASAGAIALGTYSGGWRIMRTMGRRIFSVTPPSAFAAQTAASIVMLATERYGLPVSTTHVITGSVMGVGATRRLSAVRWGVAGNIVGAWLLTIPAAGLVAAGAWGVLHLFLN
ncbi:MAG: inorganic phosphate transporter [Actinomycetia bacterium]|nr:inorganic phosphate transporter [Actinomycetes bacterium]